jgi:hypothetical protein
VVVGRLSAWAVPLGAEAVSAELMLAGNHTNREGSLTKPLCTQYSTLRPKGLEQELGPRQR